MDAESWGKLGTFIWLGAYAVFFVGAVILNVRAPSLRRLIIVMGFAFLLVVNLMLLAEYWDITDITYNPIFEEESFTSWAPSYPAWQRWYYWGGAALDVIGKSLAGIGLIMEGRHQIKQRRIAEFYANQPTV